jgi:hypothetical protein
MHISITAHDAKSSSSSASLINYLDKENEIKGLDNKNAEYENYFDSNYSAENPVQDLDKNTIVENLDSNRGSQKLDSSNYFMLNISPSKMELQHMENIANEELIKRNLDKNINDPNKIFYNEQKAELMKMQMKLYVKDVMNEYATNFKREIYTDESKLPNAREKKELNLTTEKIYTKFLKDQNIELNPKNNLEENKSNDYLNVNNITLKEEKGKSSLIEIDLKEKGKALVFVPTATLHLQKDGTYKLPKNLYEQKEKEVVSKNKEVEINYKHSNSIQININKQEQTVLNFESKDRRFKEVLSFSVMEKDISLKDGKYFISEHLLNEKQNYALDKAVEKEYGNQRDIIYKQLAETKGFDLSTRSLTGDDLLWYGKIETDRKYKFSDQWVKENKEINSSIRELEKGNKSNKKEIEALKNSLHKDKETGIVVYEGLQKGGNQTHAHVVVSRHDKTMQNARNKISLSPLANAKEAKMNNGAAVGFHRNNFTNKVEKVFDQKFNYDRSPDKTYEFHKSQKSAEMQSKLKSEGKQFIMRHTGLNAIKSNISPVQDIKKSLGIANIPTRLPKSITQVVIRVAKIILDQGLGY